MNTIVGVLIIWTAHYIPPTRMELRGDTPASTLILHPAVRAQQHKWTSEPLVVSASWIHLTLLTVTAGVSAGLRCAGPTLTMRTCECVMEHGPWPFRDH